MLVYGLSPRTVRLRRVRVMTWRDRRVATLYLALLIREESSHPQLERAILGLTEGLRREQERGVESRKANETVFDLYHNEAMRFFSTTVRIRIEGTIRYFSLSIKVNMTSYEELPVIGVACLTTYSRLVMDLDVYNGHTSRLLSSFR